ncbi:hypothetical protein Syun_024944 [Stephania yunnanensis]|uniref:Uncharacterized protein n=1 Tax=Stephania yunnanensis TaxID=152371 RepID=A0AAP0EZJ4_9MAGN
MNSGLWILPTKTQRFWKTLFMVVLHQKEIKIRPFWSSFGVLSVEHGSMNPVCK